jgi:transposase
MSCAKVVSDFEVFPAGELGRRRTWSTAEKLRIVEESYSGHRQGSVVARRHGISRSLLTQWRKAYHLGVFDGGEWVGFSPVEIRPDGPPLPRPSVVVSRKLWKFPGGALRAREGSVFQAARSRGKGSRG